MAAAVRGGRSRRKAVRPTRVCRAWCTSSMNAPLRSRDAGKSITEYATSQDAPLRMRGHAESHRWLLNHHPANDNASMPHSVSCHLKVSNRHLRKVKQSKKQ
eukprot:3260419-Pleurochrysis_carterae.AAC.2